MALLAGIWRRGAAYLPLGAALAVITGAVVAAYYLNHPTPETYPDTASYLTVTHKLLTHGQFTDPMRTPGYPLFIAIVFLLAGQGNLTAVSIAQGALFVLATVEVYAIVCLMLRRAWAAFLVGLLVGTNVMLLSFVKPILSESLSLWLTVSLALAVVIFVRTLQARHLWLVTSLTLAIFMTRAEWTYIILPLFVYVLLVAFYRRKAVQVVLHASLSVLLLSAAMVGYVNLNAAQTGFHGMTYVQNINLLGKVMQYHMQNEAPPEYSSATQIVNQYLARGATSPWDIADAEPAFSANNYALSGEYATAIIAQHPVEFLSDSVPVAIASLGEGIYARSQIDPEGPFAWPLLQLQALFTRLYAWNQVFIACLFLWAGLLLWRRTRQRPIVGMMGGVVFLVLYDLALTTLGGYGDYARFHISFDPLLAVAIWGTLLAGVILLLPLLTGKQVQGSGRESAAPALAGVSAVGSFPKALSAMFASRTIMARAPAPAAARRSPTWTDLTWNLEDFLPVHVRAASQPDEMPVAADAQTPSPRAGQWDAPACGISQAPGLAKEVAFNGHRGPEEADLGR